MNILSKLLVNYLWKAVVHPKQFYIRYRTNVGNFNAVLESGVFLDSWREGIVIPLHKKGDKMM